MSEAAIYVVQGSDIYFLARISAFPGCNASGKTPDEAVANVRRAFRDYVTLLGARGVSVEHWRAIDPDALPVLDMPQSGLLPGEDVPLEEHEIRDFLHQFEASQAALIALVEGLSPDEIERQPSNTTWSVRQALDHMMQTDITLLSRLEKWPADHFNTFQAVHRLAFQRFSVMEPDDWVDHTVMGVHHTTRRVMRRLLEHEFEHYGHIKEIIAALGDAGRAE